MSLVHLHLLLNHLPIIGIPLITSLLMYGLARRQRDVQRAALAGFVLLAALTLPAFFTGEPAEKAIEGAAGISDALVGRHEALATVATSLTGALGVCAALGLWFSRRERPIPRMLLAGGIVLAVLAIGALVPTGYYGGQIRHTELRAADAAPGALLYEEAPGR